MNLFLPIVPEKDIHSALRTILAMGNGYNMDVINDWARGFVDRDGKFIKEFQTSFSSSLWELYVYSVLKKLGQEVDFRFNTPDFVVKSHPEFVIEAVTANSKIGEPGAEESFLHNVPEDLNKFNRESCMRLSNAISEKLKKYREKYSFLLQVTEKPFVVAIAPYDRPNFNLSCQRAIEMLLFGYVVDEEAFLESENITGIPTRQMENLVKENGSEIPIGIFNTDACHEISAVIFSTCGTWGKVRALSSDPNTRITFSVVRHNLHGTKPHTGKVTKSLYVESLLDGLRVYHNPYASLPLDRAIFRHRDVFQAYYSCEAEDWVSEQRDGLLMFRIVRTEM
jgi:hypothetical protein